MDCKMNTTWCIGEPMLRLCPSTQAEGRLLYQGRRRCLWDRSERLGPDTLYNYCAEDCESMNWADVPEDLGKNSAGIWNLTEAPHRGEILECLGSRREGREREVGNFG